jgi:hypothetical protein
VGAASATGGSSGKSLVQSSTRLDEPRHGGYFRSHPNQQPCREGRGGDRTRGRERELLRPAGPKLDGATGQPQGRARRAGRAVGSQAGRGSTAWQHRAGGAACVPVRGGPSGDSERRGVQPRGRALVKETRRPRARIHDQKQEGDEKRALESAEALGARPVALAFHAFGLVEGVGGSWGQRTGQWHRKARPPLCP